jgi:hypothetical protein
MRNGQRGTVLIVFAELGAGSGEGRHLTERDGRRRLGQGTGGKQRSDG